jgi:ClpP class serine protease
MFSGEYWVAKTAQAYGLVDQVGDLRTVLRERYGKDVVTPIITPERSLFGRRAQGVTALLPERILDYAMDRPGLVEDIMSAIESRAIWARFGL